MFRLSLHSVAWGHRCHRGSADLVPQMADVGSGEQVQEGLGSTSILLHILVFSDLLCQMLFLLERKHNESKTCKSCSACRVLDMMYQRELLLLFC